MPQVPPAISSYFSELGKKGGACFTPAKQAHIERLAKARKKADRPTSSKETARAPIMKSSGKLL